MTARWSLRGVSRDDAVAAIAAVPIGVIAGVTGVGGGEYRAPVLLGLLRDIRWTIAGNLVAGVIVSGALVVLRSALFQPADMLLLAATMIVTSVPGAYLGAMLARRTPARWLSIFLAGILVATALRLLLFESTIPTSVPFGPTQAVLALLTGLGLGIISGMLGIAGGEYRIPALILIFGLPAILAGTISALVSLPQQAAALWKHRQIGQAHPRAVRLGAIMGIAGAAGVGIGVVLLGRTSDATVTAVLAGVMLLAAVRIAWEARRPEREESSAPGGLSPLP